MLAFVVAFLIFTHATGPIVAPAAVQVAAEYSDHQGFKTFAAQAIAHDVETDAE
jgi:hypothetical protein